MTTSFPLQWPDGWKRKANGVEYFISPDGIVLSVRGSKTRALAQHPDRDGYLCVLLQLETGERKAIRVHRAVCEAIHGRKPSGQEVRHLDGDKRNNAAENLRWGTQKENAADRDAHGRTARGGRNGAHLMPEKRRRGTDNGNSKLTPQAVLEILRDGRAQTVIAAAHGVNQTLVSHIKLGRIWNHVTGLPLYPSSRMAELNRAREDMRRHFGGA